MRYWVSCKRNIVRTYRRQDTPDREISWFANALDIKLTLLECTLDEGVTGVPISADTLRGMTYDPAHGVRTAGPRARIFTLLVDAGQVGSTLAVAHTLRPTIGR